MSLKIDFIQSFYAAAGKNACYAFCLIKAGQKWLCKNKKVFQLLPQWNYERFLIAGIEKKWIDFNSLNYDDASNFFVREPAKFLGYITNVEWDVIQMDRNYVAKPDEIEIDFWAKSEEAGKKGTGHFVCSGDTNTLQNSLTVRNGFIYSKRIFRRKI